MDNNLETRLSKARSKMLNSFEHDSDRGAVVAAAAVETFVALTSAMLDEIRAIRILLEAQKDA